MFQVEVKDPRCLFLSNIYEFALCFRLKEAVVIVDDVVLMMPISNDFLFQNFFFIFFFLYFCKPTNHLNESWLKNLFSPLSAQTNEMFNLDLVIDTKKKQQFVSSIVTLSFRIFIIQRWEQRQMKKKNKTSNIIGDN